MLDKLTPQMKERLEKWRKNTLPIKNERKKNQPVLGDYGDEISDLESKEQKEWIREKNQNPLYQGYYR